MNPNWPTNAYDAVQNAASGNIEHYHSSSYLNVEEFLEDLRCLGWDVIKRDDA